MSAKPKPIINKIINPLKMIYIPTKPIKYRAWLGLPPITPKDCGNVKHI